MKKIIFLLGISVLIFVGACDDCRFRICTPPDFDAENALYLQFDTTDVYSIDEILAAHIIRYVKNTDFTTVKDTFFFREQFEAGDFLMVLSDPAPFTSGGAINLNSYENYDYILRPSYGGKTYKLNNLKAKGEYQDCNCTYLNTQKTYRLDGIDGEQTASKTPIILK